MALSTSPVTNIYVVPILLEGISPFLAISRIAWGGTPYRAARSAGVAKGDAGVMSLLVALISVLVRLFSQLIHHDDKAALKR